MALIVAFEVSSPTHYDRRLRQPIWPGGASGVTWGVGYDGGHQTKHRIEADWRLHPQSERLAATAGVVGERARTVAASMADVDTPWSMAVQVFEDSTLPSYRSLTERAFGQALDLVPGPAQGALVSLVYNRGPSMLGDSRREMRTIRDACLPAGDVECVAREIRAMCRIWRGTPLEAGLCRRREAEAALAETAHA